MADEPRLSHIDPSGRARMVDVGDKRESDRRARARARVRMSPETAVVVERGDAPKGDVIGTARIAGIQAAKRTDELIPLAHPLPISYIDVEAEIDSKEGTITFTAEARTTARTGVEMEALTAVCVTLLTIYDMAKATDREMVITDVLLLEKSGGRSGAWRRE
jgi:cyclic pyranopterin monophosphate synthase